MKEWLMRIKFKTIILSLGFLGLLGSQIYLSHTTGKGFDPSATQILIVLAGLIAGLEGWDNAPKIMDKYKEIKQKTKEIKQLDKQNNDSPKTYG